MRATWPSALASVSKNQQSFTNNSAAFAALRFSSFEIKTMLSHCKLVYTIAYYCVFRASYLKKMIIKGFCLLSLFLLVATTATAQLSRNPILKHQLDSIYVLDQYYRELMSHTFTKRGADSVATVLHMTSSQAVEYIIRVMAETDSSNIKRISQYIQKIGYPGKSLVGSPTNEVAYYVIQHSTRIKQYLPIVKQAATKKELPYRFYAQMLDRQLMEEGKEQLYGTQVIGFTPPNKSKQVLIVWPISDSKNVNQRRKKAGFTQTVGESAKQFGITYRALTLEEVKKLKAN